MKSSGNIIIPAELGLCPDLGRIICDKRDIMVHMSQNEKHFLKQQCQHQLSLMQRQLEKKNIFAPFHSSLQTYQTKLTNQRDPPKTSLLNHIYQTSSTKPNQNIAKMTFELLAVRFPEPLP